MLGPRDPNEVLSNLVAREHRAAELLAQRPGERRLSCPRAAPDEDDQVAVSVSEIAVDDTLLEQFAMGLKPLRVQLANASNLTGMFFGIE